MHIKSKHDAFTSKMYIINDNLKTNAEIGYAFTKGKQP